MALDPDRCPPDPAETAEAYCMSALNAADATVFEDHYIACSRCAAVVAETDGFVRAMQSAGQNLELDLPHLM